MAMLCSDVSTSNGSLDAFCTEACRILKSNLGTSVNFVPRPICFQGLVHCFFCPLIIYSPDTTDGSLYKCWKTHVESHLQQYQCCHCTKRFEEPAECPGHEKARHKHKVCSGKHFVCPVCETRFQELRQMKTHSYHAHSLVLFRCLDSFCQYQPSTFVEFSELTRHTVNVHGGEVSSMVRLPTLHAQF